MKKLLMLSAAVALTLNAGAQAKKKTPVKDAKSGKFKTTAKGLDYWIAKDAPGMQKAAEGDYMEFNITMAIGDSMVYESRKVNNNQPVPFSIPKIAFNGDLTEGLMMLTQGDSAVFRVPADSMFAMNKQQPQQAPWFKPGTNQKLNYTVAVTKVQTKAQLEAARKANAEKRVAEDDKLIKEYAAKNNLNPQKTASGLYYVITEKGTGAIPAKGQEVTMNYTGMLLNGEKFDSNVDPKFNHVQPFTFKLGVGQVIKGWDEGIALMPVGTKGKLLIPSGMAYGERAQGPIPSNSVLIFDVEVVDIKKPQ